MKTGNVGVLATILVALSFAAGACSKKSGEESSGEKPAADAKPAPSPQSSPAASTGPDATGVDRSVCGQRLATAPGDQVKLCLAAFWQVALVPD